MESVSQLLSHLEEARQARNEDCVRLLEDVEGIRRRRQRACVRLLQELTPHLHAVRAVERELDRHLARRFNVFRYLRDDELGLSRIIADLLDPTGEHGQGATYLEAMLQLLEVPPRTLDFRQVGVETERRIRVETERGFRDRFIDITVDIPTDAGTFCLAFENKPRADDQREQCSDYLKFLDGEVSRSRRLPPGLPASPLPDARRIQSSAGGLSQGLDESLPRAALCLRMMPRMATTRPSDADGGVLVRADSGEDEAAAEEDATADDNSLAVDNPLAENDTADHEATAARAEAVVGDGASLADWFGTCCKLSDAERLRWFLREAQLYCRHHFGDSTMTDTEEARYIREYLDQNPRHLHAAFAVARAWPGVKHDVCRRFLEQLRDRVEETGSEGVPVDGRRF